MVQIASKQEIFVAQNKCGANKCPRRDKDKILLVYYIMPPSLKKAMMLCCIEANKDAT
jgi:hypothetical protein